ncbi:hypothetical protein WQQ_23110 [Hydrocarboniphaga effusa AP103]|uniref:Uncharacterized protein n=1 Tax=Hydrocarboniphaga effusa AP103 TaxID=1172194 RepID=I7ZJR2_9GAMM|nr:hypothetical protein WQQ_23110 [Hydrocarboniphaga effusa AP103]
MGDRDRACPSPRYGAGESGAAVAADAAASGDGGLYFSTKLTAERSISRDGSAHHRDSGLA